MRKYTLASVEERKTVDLKDYQDIIISSVHKVMPKATVHVESDCYYVSPTPSQGEAVRIGRLICKTKLSKYCVQVPKLFFSVEVEDDERKEQQRNGGHF